MWFCLDMKSTQRQMRWPSCWNRPRDWSGEADQTERNLPDWKRLSCQPSFEGDNSHRVLRLTLSPASTKKKGKRKNAVRLFGAEVVSAFYRLLCHFAAVPCCTSRNWCFLDHLCVFGFSCPFTWIVNSISVMRHKDTRQMQDSKPSPSNKSEYM